MVKIRDFIFLLFIGISTVCSQIAISPTTIVDTISVDSCKIHGDTVITTNSLDIILAFDLSVSSASVFIAIQSDILNILDTIKSLYTDSRFAIMTHSDYSSSYSSCGYSNKYGDSEDYPYNLDANFTSDVYKIDSTINQLWYLGGHDNPESSERLFYETYSDTAVHWRPYARKVVLYFGDDKPHSCDIDLDCLDTIISTGSDPGRDGIMGNTDDITLSYVLDSMSSRHIHLIPVYGDDGIGSSDYNLYKCYASKTGDSAYVINNDDGTPPGGISLPKYIYNILNKELDSHNPSNLPPMIDIMFGMDVTGSMFDILFNFKDYVTGIMDSLRTSGSDVRFGFMTHVDYPDSFNTCGYKGEYGESGVGDYPYNLVVPLGYDDSLFLFRIDTMWPYSGEDIPESSERLFYETYSDTSIHWRLYARKVLIYFGDEIGHSCNLTLGCDSIPGSSGGDPGRDGIMSTLDDILLSEAIRGMKNNKINLFVGYCRSVVSPGFLNDSLTLLYYNCLASRTNGSLIRLGVAPTTEFLMLDSVTREMIYHVDTLSLKDTSNLFTSWISSITPPYYTNVYTDSNKTYSFDVELCVPPGTPDSTYIFNLSVIGEGAIYTSQQITITVLGGCPDPLDSAYNYTLIAGGDITWLGSGNSNLGDSLVHSNGSLLTSGISNLHANITAHVNVVRSGSSIITGNVKAPAIVQSSTGKITGTKKIGAVPEVSIPSIDFTSYYDYAVLNGAYHNGDVVFSGTSDTVLTDSILYVNGDFTLNGSMDVKGSIIATGDITVNGTGTITRSMRMPALASINGDIYLSGTGTITGLIYTKTGNMVKAGTCTVRGSIICKEDFLKIGKGFDVIYQKVPAYSPDCE